MSLESIDTSYWLTKDKAWKAEREAQWPAIERVLSLNRRKGDVNVIKQYFLKGKMPKWEKYQDWDDLFRHLDLRLFLWLHPSSDTEVLKPLYRAYMESDLIHERDITLGYGLLLNHELIRATGPYKSLKEYPFPFMGEKNIILFRIMFEDMGYVKGRVFDSPRRQTSFDEDINNIDQFIGYHHFLRIRSWLLQAPDSSLMLNCLYQFDDVLQWALTTMPPNKALECVEEFQTPVALKSYQRALHCLYHFDTEKEGDTARARSVHNIRKILDERDFFPEFKQLWGDVKSGKIEVKEPWKR